MATSNGSTKRLCLHPSQALHYGGTSLDGCGFSCCSAAAQTDAFANAEPLRFESPVVPMQRHVEQSQTMYRALQSRRGAHHEGGAVAWMTNFLSQRCSAPLQEIRLNMQSLLQEQTSALTRCCLYSGVYMSACVKRIPSDHIKICINLPTYLPTYLPPHAHIYIYIYTQIIHLHIGCVCVCLGLFQDF